MSISLGRAPGLPYSSLVERVITSGLASRLFGADPARALALLRAAWPLAVGPELARRTEVIALEGQSLRIGVPDAGWWKGLLRMQGQILSRLREVAGDLAPRRLGFKDGLRVPPAEPPPIWTPPPVGPVPPALAAQAERIADPEIRARFLQSAARYLSRFPPPEDVSCAKP